MNNILQNFLTWLKNPNPDTTLVKLWQRKRARDKAIQRIEAKQKAEEYRQRVAKEADLFWEADGKPEDKKDHYRTLAIDKIKAKNIPTIYKPYYLLEKRILEPIDNWIRRQASISILSQLAILAAIVAFIGGEKVRRNNEIFTAWQTITSADGQSGSGGRIKALQFLNSRPLKFPWIGWTDEKYYWNNKKCDFKRLIGLRWEAESLTNLSVNENAHLSKIHLCNANLTRAKLTKANLSFSDLTGADLTGADLTGANLSSSNLKGAILKSANLKGANLSFANLKEAELNFANLEGANLNQSDLTGTDNSTPKAIKSACYWQKAVFEPDFRNLLDKEPDQQPDCSKWKNNE